MRVIIIFYFFLSVECSLAQISKVDVSDARLLKIIDLTIDTLAVPENELGAIMLEFSNFNIVESQIEVADEKFGKAFKKNEALVYDVKSSFNMNEILLTYRPPSCYFFYRNRPVLLYFGPEKFINVKAEDISALKKKLKKYFRRDGRSYTSPSCWWKVNGAEVVLLRKWTVSW